MEGGISDGIIYYKAWWENGSSNEKGATKGCRKKTKLWTIKVKASYCHVEYDPYFILLLYLFVLLPLSALFLFIFCYFFKLYAEREIRRKRNFMHYVVKLLIRVKIYGKKKTNGKTDTLCLRWWKKTLILTYFMKTNKSTNSALICLLLLKYFFLALVFF